RAVLCAVPGGDLDNGRRHAAGLEPWATRIAAGDRRARAVHRRLELDVDRDGTGGNGDGGDRRGDGVLRSGSAPVSSFVLASSALAGAGISSEGAAFTLCRIYSSSRRTRSRSASDALPAPGVDAAAPVGCIVDCVGAR